MSLQVGLTGGIGSGKSTVARMLGDLGAVVVDLDVLARAVVAPGTPGLAAVGALFPGAGGDGILDRAVLAGRVFSDPRARERLEAITHPLIRAAAREIAEAAPAQAVVVHDVPLLVEKGLQDAYDLVVVVAAAEPVRRERLRRFRGMGDEEITARMRAQADDQARRAVADAWLVNEGTEEDLRAAVDHLWRNVLVPAARAS